MDTDLAKKMIDRADKDVLPADHPMRIQAHDFDAACKGYLSSPQTVKVGVFFGCWSRARKTWCAYTGEQLI